MPVFKPIYAGDRFDRLQVVSDRHRGDSTVSCVCDCGRHLELRVGQWGKTRSCGCLRIELLVARSTTHGHTGTSIYMTWSDMVNRCNNPSHKRWMDYGGRGITVCDRWNPRRGGCFENFLTDMGERPDGLTLDRIENDGNYEPGNCRWATLEEQRGNRRPQRLKPQCKHGHEFTPENTSYTPDGKRRCKACGRIWAAEARARRMVPA